MKIVQKPRCPARFAFTNSASRDEPSTISGDAIGRKIRRFAAPRPRKEWGNMANAINVPRSVAIAVGSRPRFRLVPTGEPSWVEAHRSGPVFRVMALKLV